MPTVEVRELALSKTPNLGIGKYKVIDKAGDPVGLPWKCATVVEANRSRY